MKLSPQQVKLYKAIDEILWNDWDPINVKMLEDWPRDEYESYIPSIFNLKVNGASIEAIALRLFKIETESIGINGSYENCALVAEKISNLN